MSARIKITLLIDVLENIAGGAERQVYELIKTINKEKFDISLFILHQKEQPIEIKKLGVMSCGLGVKRIYDIDGIIKGFKFAKFLEKEKTDILMTYHFGSDVWGAIFGKLGKAPVIISNRRDMGFWRKKIHIFTYKVINRWVSKIVVVSNALKKMVIREERVPVNKIQVIYNGVDLGRFKTRVDTVLKKKEIGVSSDCKIIGCVGNLRAIKGHIFLIEAIPEVLKRFPEAHFLFIGDGELKQNLKFKVESLKVEKNAHFLGRRSDVPELLQIMDICILPSLSEGLSNTLLEYMAEGKPVIATSVGGTPEVVENEKNGILVAPKDSHILGNQVIRLLENKTLASNLGIAAKNTVSERFDLQKQTAYMEEFFVNLLGNKTKKELRVMHLISSCGVFGAEKVMLKLAFNMNQNGIKSWVVAIKNSLNPHLEIIEHAKKLNIPHGSVECKGRLDFKTIPQLVEIIRQNDIDLIHTHNYKANLLGFLAARKTKIPIIATNHLWNRADLKLVLYEYIDIFILKRFINKIIAVSTSIRNDMVKKGIPDSKIEVIFNGIEVGIKNTNEERFKNIFNIGKDKTIIGVVARLSPEKGHRFLFGALREILKFNPNLRLLVIGEGDFKGKLEKQVKKFGIDKETIFTGYQNNMNEIFSRLDILVHPSLREGLPIALLEAMTFGKAIIATNVGGVGDLIKNRVTGLLIKPASCKEIYDTIRTLLTDADLKKTLGENAKRFVAENYSIEKMVDKHKRLYREVTNWA